MDGLRTCEDSVDFSWNYVHFHRRMKRNVDSIVLGQAAGVEHVSFYSRTELLISPYNEP